MPTRWRYIIKLITSESTWLSNNLPNKALQMEIGNNAATKIQQAYKLYKVSKPKLKQSINQSPIQSISQSIKQSPRHRSSRMSSRNQIWMSMRCSKIWLIPQPNTPSINPSITQSNNQSNPTHPNPTQSRRHSSSSSIGIATRHILLSQVHTILQYAMASARNHLVLSATATTFTSPWTQFLTNSQHSSQPWTLQTLMMMTRSNYTLN